MKGTTLLPALFVLLAMTAANAQIPAIRTHRCHRPGKPHSRQSVPGPVPPAVRFGPIVQCYSRSESVQHSDQQLAGQCDKWGCHSTRASGAGNHYDLGHTHSAFVAQCDARVVASQPLQNGRGCARSVLGCLSNPATISLCG